MVEFLRLVGHRWRIIVSFVLLGVIAGAVITYLTPSSYKASAELFVGLGEGTGDNATGLAASGIYVQNRIKSYPELVDTPLVLNPVIEDLKLSVSAEDLADDVSAEVDTGTVLMKVIVDEKSASQAAAIANAVAKETVKLIETIDRSPGGSAPVTLTVVRPATVPSKPSTPIPWLNILIGLFAGLGIGLAAAALRETTDTTIKNENDITEATGLPTIALIPTNPDVATTPVVTQSGSSPTWAEAYRKLRTNLSYLDPDHPARCLLVTSSAPGDGKTMTAANLAATIAQSGRRAVLVEADLRRPSVSRVLGLIPDVGVTNVVAGKATISEVVQAADGFDVITSGPIPPNPSELLGSQAFHRMLQSLLVSYDNVVIDTPPLLAVTDAAVAAVNADAVIVVSRYKKTRRQDLRKALEGLRAVDANVAGVVVNQVAQNSAYYYQYEYRSTRSASGRR